MSTLKANLLVTPQEIFTSSSTQGADLGAYATSGDGRGFRYCLAGGTTLVPGKLQQASAEDTSNYQNLAPSAAAVGATSITVTTSTTITANALTNGWAMISVTPGQGYQYGIKANTATSGAAGLVLTLSDPIQVALTTSSRLDVIPNPYASVVVNPTTATSSPVGVAVYGVTNAQYGWLQTHGPANVLADGTVTVGTAVVASNGTAGAVEALTGVQAPVGLALTGIATTEYGSIFLTID